MKIASFFVAGALSLASLNARAQDAAPLISPDAPPPIVTPDAPQNGYQTLVAAGKLILPGENGGASAIERNLSPAENLRRERLAVARNAPAMKMMREALQMPIERPKTESFVSFSGNARFRELARQLSQESDVRAADGDFAGALGSRLDCIELGVLVSLGTFVDMMSGNAIEAIGRAKLETIASRLDAKSCRNASARLAQIEGERATFAQNIRLEGDASYQMTLQTLNDKEARQALSTPEGRKKIGLDDAPVSEAQAREFLSLTPETLRQSNRRFYDAALGIAAMPFQKARLEMLPKNVDFYTAMATFIVEKPTLRFFYERAVTQNQLLQLALQLRAEKLETGTYPTILAAPADRFSPDLKPLVYKRAGQSYTLYSVGPDGMDNGGTAFASTRQIFDPDSGVMQTYPTRGVQLDSKGDILAPVF